VPPESTPSFSCRFSTKAMLTEGPSRAASISWELLLSFDAADVRRRDSQALLVKLLRKTIDHHRQCG
jgi:hypothetical protein